MHNVDVCEYMLVYRCATHLSHETHRISVLMKEHQEAFSLSPACLSVELKLFFIIQSSVVVIGFSGPS